MPNRLVTRSMNFTKDTVDDDSSDNDEAPPLLNPQAEPFVPQTQGEPVAEDEVDILREPIPLTSTPIGLIYPATPSACTSQVDLTSPRRVHSMIKAHPPSQMLSSTTSRVRTRSSYETLIANQAFVSLQEPKCIKDALLDPDWVDAMQDELQ